MNIIRAMLRLSELQALDVLKLGVAKRKSNMQFSGELLQVDEYQACLDDHSPNACL